MRAKTKHTWPPGFRFHPTDEELVLYYLKGKICRKRLKLDIIGETDVYKCDPEELPGQSKLRTEDRQWFFFSPRDRKYPNGARSNRATRHGYWKATGKDRNIIYKSRTAGVKKTLVFYKGRAPSGVRTDWVMHEYTLDEEELKRCETARDYYALYKVFKKSGPGPKNGEQYGAPFKEEDWADDEFTEMDNFIINQDIPAMQVKGIVSVDSSEVNCQVQSPLNDIDDIRNQIIDNPALNKPPSADYTLTQPQVFCEEETRSTMVDPSIREATFTERSTVLHSSSQQRGLEPSFDFTQSATSILQFNETPEITSAPDTCEQNCHLGEEDFLEMDDLIGPEPTPSNVMQPTENLQFDELDGLSDFDLYHDAAMFLRDMGPIDQGTGSNPYLNNFENEMVNHLDYQLLSHLDDADQISSQLWTHDQRNNIFTPAQSNLGTVSLPSSGVVHTGNSTNIPTEATPNQSGQEGDVQQNWFTSSIWSFVESIPTTPASASESALVNRAFERMSSFSRVRINARNTTAAAATAGNGDATVRRARKVEILFLFSVIVAMFAILWMLMKGKGKTSSVLDRYISL